MDLKEKLILKRLEKVYCRLAPSNVDKKGIGIFAIRQIPIGVNPFNNSYQAQGAIQVNRSKIKDQEIIRLLNDYHPSEKLQVVSEWPNQPIWTNYLNYSDTPNIQLMPNGEWATLRNIEIGEELLENPKNLFNEDGSQKIFKITAKQYPNLSFS